MLLRLIVLPLDYFVSNQKRRQAMLKRPKHPNIWYNISTSKIIIKNRPLTIFIKQDFKWFDNHLNQRVILNKFTQNL